VFGKIHNYELRIRTITNERIATGIRVLLGAGLVLIGLNKFFGWMTPPYKGEGLEFITVLGAAGGGYIWTMVSVVEISSGISFLTNRFVPFMAIVLFPVMLNAVLYHLFLDFNIPGFTVAVLCLAMNIALMFAHKSAFREILKMRQSK